MMRRMIFLAILLAFWLPTFLWMYWAMPQGLLMTIVAPLAWILALRVLAPPIFYYGLAEMVQLFERITGKTIN